MKADYKNWMPKGMVMGTGCGSGALTIACAKKNPGASFTGIDRWGKEYLCFLLYFRQSLLWQPGYVR